MVEAGGGEPPETMLIINHLHNAMHVFATAFNGAVG